MDHHAGRTLSPAGCGLNRSSKSSLTVLRSASPAVTEEQGLPRPAAVLRLGHRRLHLLHLAAGADPVCAGIHRRESPAAPKRRQSRGEAKNWTQITLAESYEEQDAS